MLELLDISKRFGGVVALRGVSLRVDKGEVLALVGENGAGKSTLLKVLGGIHRPDHPHHPDHAHHPNAGEIRVDGKPVVFNKPADSLDRGIAFIHQELSVLDNLDIAGNVHLGRELTRFGLLNRGAMCRASAIHMNRLGMTLDPATPLKDLSIAQRQMVEIARALSLDARLIIMDEPTSSLTLDETDRLLTVIDGLRCDGVSVIYVSHRLAEIGRIADRVTVLRDGRNAGELTRGADDPLHRISHDNMVRMMVGRDLQRHEIGSPRTGGRVAVSLERVRTRAFPKHEVSIEFRAGEILGVAGLVGAGRSALAQTVFGAEPLVGGRVLIEGQRPLRLRSTRDAIGERIYLVPEDRRGRGLLLDFSISANVTLASLNRHSTLGLVRRQSEIDAAVEVRDRLDVKTDAVDTRVGNLSGGNQQKIVLGKWLAFTDKQRRPIVPRLFILDEPTRGIDVGAKASIYQLMRKLADDGAAIWMVSSDMEEVLAISDRVAVMREGRLAGVLDRADCTEESIMQLAVGAEVATTS